MMRSVRVRDPYPLPNLLSARSRPEGLVPLIIGGFVDSVQLEGFVTPQNNSGFKEAKLG